MEVLSLTKTLLKALNLWPYKSSFLSKIRHVATISFCVLLLIGSFGYFVINLDDINEATDPGFVTCAYITSIFTYCWMISKKSMIRDAICELETIVKQRN